MNQVSRYLLLSVALFGAFGLGVASGSEEDNASTEAIQRILVVTNFTDRGAKVTNMVLSSLARHEYEDPALAEKSKRVLAELRLEKNDKAYAAHVASRLQDTLDAEEFAKVQRLMEDPSARRWFGMLRRNADKIAEADKEWMRGVSTAYSKRLVFGE